MAMGTLPDINEIQAKMFSKSSGCCKQQQSMTRRHFFR
ncbi:hypothetical protein EPIR_2234 [Erwinia piriflorinigrans CFBP 5888]|uniref:Uncharacterized protein n=1 Tax=Erwinia piriflorinigrans CFBP 5888 TaxID=1161919 RepID=V5Z8P9_9GAMM|nr:hypothetical protein EPIR_2234 [Erwinia piriflorinigrans CFBP 5888]